MRHIAILAALLCVSPCLRAADTIIFQPAGGANLDQAAFAQWVDGKESLIAEDAAKDGPYSVMWTALTRPDWRSMNALIATICNTEVRVVEYSLLSFRAEWSTLRQLRKPCC